MLKTNKVVQYLTNFYSKRHLAPLAIVLASVCSLLALLFSYFDCTTLCTKRNMYYNVHKFFVPNLPPTKLFGNVSKNPIDHIQFNINSTEDIIVFLHIQKTGGTTFGRHLVQELTSGDGQALCLCHKPTSNVITEDFVTLPEDVPNLENLNDKQIKRMKRRRQRKKKKKKKKCDCRRPNSQTVWLFSRYSTGWKCGLHADWTELSNCVDDWFYEKEGDGQGQRKYFYITILREPVSRYISEFRHVQRGATWKASSHYCNNRLPSFAELPSCFATDTWEDVTMDEFIDCDYNLAHNRMTRMLANLSLVNCYNKTGMSQQERDNIMLTSAKKNLHDMIYFALVEFQMPSQYMFEKTFRMQFTVDFELLNRSKSRETVISDEQMEKIKNRNFLDIKLYNYAKQLFLNRYEYFQQSYPEDFENDLDLILDTTGSPF